MRVGGMSWATVVAAICAGAIAGCGDGTEDAAPPRLVTTDDPIATFAPLVRLHERERAYPMSAETFLDNSSLTWANGDISEVKLAEGPARVPLETDDAPLIEARRLGDADPYRHRWKGRSYAATDLVRPFDPGRAAGLPEGAGLYLDLGTAVLDGERPVHVRPGKTVQGTPVYAETHPTGRRALRMTYWMLFGRHAPSPSGATAHEGDWERVSVLVRRTSRRRRFAPLSVTYHQGGQRRTVPWRAAQVSARTHPQVLLARGSHTPRAGTCERCPKWRTWETLRDARRQPWYGFGGAWGSIWRSDATTGPLGPSRHLR